MSSYIYVQQKQDAYRPQKSSFPSHIDGHEDIPEQLSESGTALLTITVYDRTPTSPFYVHRASTHVLLTSQTLGDLYDVIPCPSKEQPSETRDEDGILTGYDLKQPESSGCVLCVNGVAYGDGLEVEDYAEYVIKSGSSNDLILAQ